MKKYFYIFAMIFSFNYAVCQDSEYGYYYTDRKLFSDISLNEIPAPLLTFFRNADKKINNNEVIDCVDEVIIAVNDFVQKAETKNQMIIIVEYLESKGIFITPEFVLASQNCKDIISFPGCPDSIQKPLNQKEYIQTRADFYNYILKFNSDFEKFEKELEDYNNEGIRINQIAKEEKLRIKLNYDVYKSNNQGIEEDEKRWFRAAVSNFDIIKETFDYMARGRYFIRTGNLMTNEMAKFIYADFILDKWGFELANDENILLKDDGTIINYPVAGYRNEINESIEYSNSEIEQLRKSFSENIDQLSPSISDTVVNIISEKLLELNNYTQKLESMMISYNRRLKSLEASSQSFDSKYNILNIASGEISKEYNRLLYMEEQVNKKIRKGYKLAAKKAKWRNLSDAFKLKIHAWENYFSSINYDEKLEFFNKEVRELNYEESEIKKLNNKINKLKDELFRLQSIYLDFSN